MNLGVVKVLYRDRDLALWGIPYLMRPGQSPRDLKDAHDDWRPLPPGHYGGMKRPDLSDWIWLGSSGWFGSMTREQIQEVKTFLDENKELLPMNPYEWSELP